MLVLVSFVLVLAAAVTLVIGLLQSGLALIYLSIGCSVLAGVVLAVAVLRGRPEPQPAAAGRSFSPPPQPTQVPASVGAPSTATETSSSWSAPATPPPPPPPAYTPPAATQPDDSAKAAGAALLGRLRGRRGEPAPMAEAEPVAADIADGTTEMPVVATPVSAEDDDGFPIPDYDRLRATELLSQLPGLDRNQLEAVREREAGGKNRFTIMSRVDALLATADEPAWDAEDDEWEAGDDAQPEAMIGARVLAVDEDDEVDAEELDAEDLDEYELEEEEVAMAASAFPIPSYETLTVGQILPRLSELDADELAQVRTREEMGRSRGTILDRIDRLASRRTPAAMAMPAAVAPVVKAAVRKAPVRRAPAVSKTTAPAVKRKATAPARRRAAPAIAVPPVRKAAVARKAPAKSMPAPRKTRAPKAVAPLIPAAPMKKTVKKAAAAAKKARKG